MKTILPFIFAIILTNSFSQTPGNGAIDIDGNQYESVIINGLEWFTSDLVVTKFNNGDDIPNISDNTSWSNLSINGDPGLCYFGNSPQGHTLYNYYAMDDSLGLCPLGWRIPSKSNIESLVSFLEPGFTGNPMCGPCISEDAGLYMKSNTCWNGDNSSGLSICGNRSRQSNGQFNITNSINVDMPTSSEWSTTEIHTFTLQGDDNPTPPNPGTPLGWIIPNTKNKNTGFPVRCVKNNSSIGLIELKDIDKELVKIVNQLGQEVEYTPNTLLIYIYSDGSSEKVFKLEY